MSSLRTRLSPRLQGLVAGIALSVLVGSGVGIVLAATTYTGPLTGCLKPGGAVNKIAKSATTPAHPCLATETKITIGNVPGPSGAPGSPGPSGAPGVAVCSGFPHYTIDWHGCDLRFANLSNAVLSVADLRGANLGGANLAGANLAGANLTQIYSLTTTLLAADLTNASLLGSGGTPIQREYATYSNTTCPNGNIQDSDCW